QESGSRPVRWCRKKAGRIAPPGLPSMSPDRARLLDDVAVGVDHGNRLAHQLADRLLDLAAVTDDHPGKGIRPDHLARGSADGVVVLRLDARLQRADVVVRTTIQLHALDRAEHGAGRLELAG